MDLPQNMTIFAVNDNPRSYAEKYNVPMEQGVDGRNAELMGTAGASVFWTLEDGTLTLFGCGPTSFFSCGFEMAAAWNDGARNHTVNPENASYYPYRDEIERIVIEPGVTHLNLYTFRDMPNLKSIDFGTVSHVYCEAISNCGLEEVIFPESVVHIREKAVLNCQNLRRIEIQNGSEFVGHILKGNLPALEEVTFLGNPRIQQVFDKMLTNYGAAEVMLYVREGTTAHSFAQSTAMAYQLVK